MGPHARGGAGDLGHKFRGTGGDIDRILLRQGGGGGGTTVTAYSYFANFAVALCEGPIDRIGRVWADGKELDVRGLTMRLHTGSETQEPDSLMLAKEGADAAPAYRGTAYVVFEGLPVGPFGNRLPQLSFEVFRAVAGQNNMCAR